MLYRFIKHLFVTTLNWIQVRFSTPDLYNLHLTYLALCCLGRT